MTDDELVEVLKKFETTRVEKLNDNSKRLFYAIMKIADERDELKEENQRLKKDYATIVSDNCDYLLLEKENQRINNVLNELRQFVIELYKVEYNQTGDWWLQEQLSSWYDDMNIATDFKIDDIILKRLNELKESNNGQ